MVLVIAASLLSSPTLAQKRLADPRPLTGLDRSHIPTYSSVEEYLQAAPRGNLLERATPVSRSTISMRSLAPVASVSGRSVSGKQLAPFDLVRIDRADNGTIRWMSGKIRVGTAGLIPASKNQAAAMQEAAFTVLETVRQELRLENPREELRPMTLNADDLGYTHARFEQTYAGIPVWGRDLYVHFDEQGDVYAINGTYEPTPRGLDTRAQLESTAALDRVVQALRDENRWAPLPVEIAAKYDVPRPTSRLVLYPTNEGMRLAYEVTLHANLIEWFTYVVDARDGAVLNRIERHCTLDHSAEVPLIEVGEMASPAAASAGPTGTFFDAQGIDLNGVNQTFRVYQHDDGVYYSAWDLRNWNSTNSKMPDEPAGGALTLTLNNTDFGKDMKLFHVTSSNNTWSDPAGVSAAVNMRTAYDYFKDIHARNAIDGQDQSIISILHATDGGKSFDNAFWTGRFMVYGDGDQLFKPLAGALDVAGHEMSHGVIEYSAGLVYQFQPGALNESFADVFGSMVDPGDQLMGEDIMQPGKGIALRDLLNPDNPQIPGPQPAHMNQYRDLTIQQDNGGVHINSGIPNRAAALIVNQIGHQKTEAIYYRALTNYLTRNSQFGDARKAVVQSATDLHGANSPEANAAMQAFDQVGITDETSGGNGGGGGNVPPQTGGTSYITFMVEDGSIGLLDLTDPANPTIGLFESQDAVARANIEFGDLSQLTSAANGERIWFINDQGQLAFVELANGQVSVYENLSIQQPGDLWTASISPDENFVAIVSAYAEDPTLYFFNGETLSAVELKPEGTQEGVFIETIKYPDVVSWSPNPEHPHIAFDAYNEVDLDQGVAAFWGMYEIDFSAEKIYNLIPAQPSNVSVGNVAYSKLSGDLIAFNYIDEEGVFDIMIGDFAAGDIYALDIPSFTYGGNEILDAQRPTFAPDDALLAFASPSLSALMFYEPVSGQLNALDIPVPIYNPYWLLVGGTSHVDTEEEGELPGSLTLEGNYPNPFNPSTTIRFSIAAASDVRLDVYDVMGRHLRTLHHGPMPAGQHSVSFDAGGLASGTYLARLVAGGEVATHRMVLVR